jgi:hypothetical protein
MRRTLHSQSAGHKLRVREERTCARIHAASRIVARLAPSPAGGDRSTAATLRTRGWAESGNASMPPQAGGESELRVRVDQYSPLKGRHNACASQLIPNTDDDFAPTHRSVLSLGRVFPRSALRLPARFPSGHGISSAPRRRDRDRKDSPVFRIVHSPKQSVANCVRFSEDYLLNSR